MAELVVSAVGLASLFNSAVSCFECVRIANTFDQDLATAQLKLDAAAIRLSRWGAAMGMNASEKTLPEVKRAHANEALQNVLWLFERAEEKSERFGSGRSTVTYEARMEMWPVEQFVHAWMVEKTRSRVDQKKTGMRERGKWALYKKKELDSLIDDIVHMLEALEAVVPYSSLYSSASNELQKLAQAEVADICRDASRKADRVFATVELAEALRVAAGTGTDPYLEDSVKMLLRDLKTESNRAGTTYNVNQKVEAEVKDNRGIFAAVNHGSMTNHYGEQ
jgi:hypothetical protein